MVRYECDKCKKPTSDLALKSVSVFMRSSVSEYGDGTYKKDACESCQKELKDLLSLFFNSK